MAAGVPVIVTDRVGCAAEIGAALAGLVARCDAADIADKLLALLRDRELQARLGERGRQLVEQRFALPCTSKALVGIYDNVLTQHAALAHGTRTIQPGQ
jgi:glycosyltransferase involved in cell wall biosynthesis